MKKLLIIGNGFDLHCGLKTSYTNFFEHLKNQNYYENGFKFIRGENEVKNENRINIWWALLLSYYDECEKFIWKDIEDIIKSFLSNEKNSKYINFIKKMPSANDYENWINKNIFDLGKLKLNKYKARFLNLLNYFQNSDELINFNYDKNGKFKKIKFKKIEEIYDILKSDLDAIENEFLKYLEEQIRISYENEAIIHSNANILYAKILELNLIDDKPYYCFSNEQIRDEINNSGSDGNWMEEIIGAIRNTNIISFNFTRLGFPITHNGKYNLFKNIHGTIHNAYIKDIIFGIDSTNIQPDSMIYKFTKTFRLSILEGKNLNEKDKFTANLNLNNVKEIIIYGHSLNEQDYVYFYSIFNKLNISETDLKIKLFYSDFDNIDKSLERNLDLQQLIYKYSNDFDKKPGLYHRMLIEGRIAIKKI